MTKGPSIEAAALLAVLYRERLAPRITAKTLDRLCGRTSEITVVADALTAFASGGVHAMHDATEGGVLGGLWEMAEASGLAVHADLDAVDVPEDIAALAEALGFDPWQAISEGTLLAAVAPRSVDAVLTAWKRAGIPGCRVGSFEARVKRSTIRRDGKRRPLREPGIDPFWPLFFAGLAQRSK